MSRAPFRNTLLDFPPKETKKFTSKKALQLSKGSNRRPHLYFGYNSQDYLCVCLLYRMSSVVTVCNLINNSFIEPRVAAYVDVISPATGEPIAKVPLCGQAEVDEAVTAAMNAFPGWSGLTIKQRAAILLKFHYLCNEHAEELADIITKENGKNIVEALADVAKGNETTEFACSLPQLAQGKSLKISGGITCRDERIPLGVVGAIVPFNFPAMVPMWTIPIALTMGNCVLLKPSEKVPMTMSRMAELMILAGIPAGVFQIVQGGAEVVTSICEHKNISAVTFVGSSKVAEIVSTSCHRMNKRVLALGGAKNHLVVLSDCDIGMAARDIVASFAGCCGQRCMAASVLIIVDADRTDSDIPSHPVLQEVVALAGKLQPGQGAGEVGPLIDSIAKSRVMSYIEESAAGGARVLLDGRHWSSKRPKGNWIGPTIILHSNRADRALHDEIFGPVLSVIRVRSFEEAIDIENANPYGNAACVYTERGGHAEWFVKRFRAAMLGVNIGIPVPREPFSFGKTTPAQMPFFKP